MSWTFEVARAGEYGVQAVYSCAAGTGGSEFSVSVGEQKLTARTAETGAWTTYAPRDLGKIRLEKAGQFTLTVKPQTPPPWKAMGLQRVLLSPAP